MNEAHHFDEGIPNNIPCPLTPALLELLQVCVELESVNTEKLAEHLNLAPSSIASRFKRINVLMDAHSREEVLLKAIRLGWIQVRASPGANVDLARVQRNRG